MLSHTVECEIMKRSWTIFFSDGILTTIAWQIYKNHLNFKFERSFKLAFGYISVYFSFSLFWRLWVETKWGSSHWNQFWKIGVLKVPVKIVEKILWRSSFSISLGACNFAKIIFVIGIFQGFWLRILHVNFTLRTTFWPFHYQKNSIFEIPTIPETLNMKN